MIYKIRVEKGTIEVYHIEAKNEDEAKGRALEMSKLPISERKFAAHYNKEDVRLKDEPRDSDV